MATFETGQVWELYSDRDGQWSRAIVAEIRDDQIILRYEGTLELVTTTPDEMLNNQKVRPIID